MSWSSLLHRPVLSVLALSCGLAVSPGGLIACSDGGGSLAEGPDGGVPTRAVRFDLVFDQVLRDVGCVFGCHDASAAGGLALQPGETLRVEAQPAYDALVGVTSHSADCAGEILVVPGDGEASLLWRKLEPTAHRCGDLMPRGANFIRQDQIDLVRRWIDDGALR